MDEIEREVPRMAFDPTPIGEESRPSHQGTPEMVARTLSSTSAYPLFAVSCSSTFGCDRASAIRADRRCSVRSDLQNLLLTVQSAGTHDRHWDGISAA